MWLDTSLFLLAIVAIANAIFGFSGTQTSYVSQPFFQCHSLEACYVYLSTPSTVTITNQRRTSKMVVQHTRHHTLFCAWFCSLQSYSPSSSYTQPWSFIIVILLLALLLVLPNTSSNVTTTFKVLTHQHLNHSQPQAPLWVLFTSKS